MISLLLLCVSSFVCALRLSCYDRLTTVSGSSLLSYLGQDVSPFLRVNPFIVRGHSVSVLKEVPSLVSRRYSS